MGGVWIFSGTTQCLKINLIQNSIKLVFKDVLDLEKILYFGLATGE